MSVIIKGFDKPEDCLGCPFLSKLTEVFVGSEGLYQKIGHCKFAPDIMPDLEDPWHDMEWLHTHTEEWCPITQVDEWPEIPVNIQMTEEDLKEFQMKLRATLLTACRFEEAAPLAVCQLEEQETRWVEGKEGEEA